MRVFAGIKPTNDALHLGNYFGALRQFVALQDEHPETLYFIADYHSMTTVRDGKQRRANTHDVALDYLGAGVDPERAIVLLAHDPATFRRARKTSVGLQISGHTHGGQIWPFGWLVRLSVPWVAGLYRAADAQIYVSCGTGFWGPPMRLGTQAEITEFVLTRAADPEP